MKWTVTTYDECDEWLSLYAEDKTLYPYTVQLLSMDCVQKKDTRRRVEKKQRRKESILRLPLLILIPPYAWRMFTL